MRKRMWAFTLSFLLCVTLFLPSVYALDEQALTVNENVPMMEAAPVDVNEPAEEFVPAPEGVTEPEEKVLMQEFLLQPLADPSEEQITITLKDSQGNGLAGGVVSYYANGWVQGAGTTDGNGQAVINVPAGKKITHVGVDYKGGLVRIKQDMTENPVYNFTTVPVTVKLLSSKDIPLEGLVTHHGTAAPRGGWMKFGDGGEGKTNTTMEMLPFTYTFQVDYKSGMSQQKVTISAETNEVIFRTKLVTLKFLDEKNNPLEGKATHHGTAAPRGGWISFGDEGKTNTDMEMLAYEYAFNVVHNGKHYNQKVDLRDADKKEVVFGGSVKDSDGGSTPPVEPDPDDEEKPTPGNPTNDDRDTDDTPEITIPDEEIPAGAAPEDETIVGDVFDILPEDVPGGVLPQTGGVSPILLYGLGALLTGAGIVRRRKEEN